MSASHERRKRRLMSQTSLAAPQIEPRPFRANGQEILRTTIKALGAAIREDYSLALASAMLGKARDKVTTAEALEALHSSLMITDPVEHHRVIRSGLRSLFARISPDLFPMAHASLVVAALDRLDFGDEAAGILTPTPTTRHGGGEARHREKQSSRPKSRFRWAGTRLAAIEPSMSPLVLAAASRNGRNRRRCRGAPP